MPPSDYRADLFAAYPARLAELDPDQESKITWFEEYYARNYAPHLARYDAPTTSVLDVGCSRGYLLAALGRIGYVNMTGIDLSAGDIEAARQLIPQATLACADATQYLEARSGGFDIVILRAVVEHTPKTEVLPLLRAVHRSLTPDGTAVVDVPNMDWLFAGHERYMDFTHEVGFTRESLRQVMATAFTSVAVAPVDHLTAVDRSSWRTKVARRVLGRLLLWADPQGAQNPIWARNLVAVGRK
jgi:2-polyprenyl-3-methyl-5-hydroxy-6-metoxy-1,4-benzoquinol methylase